MRPPNYDCPLPSHVRRWIDVLAAASPQAIDRAIAEIYARIPVAKRRNRLRPAAQRFLEMRLKDLKRTALTAQQARDFAEAEVRLRQCAADVTGDDETIEASDLRVRLLDDGSLMVLFMPLATYEGAAAIQREFGFDTPSPGNWEPGDFDPSARGGVH